MDGFGIHLKTQREKRGIRLEEIASITKINLHSLQLMEADQWKELPPEPFIRGFIIAYAKYVGLDAKESVAKFIEQTKGSQTKEVCPAAPPMESISSHNPSEVIRRATASFRWKLSLATLGIVMVSTLAYITYVGKQVSERKVAQVELKSPNTVQPSIVLDQATRHELVPVDPSTEKLVKAADLLAPPLTTAMLHEIRIESRERTWVKVVRDDEKPEETFLTSGQVANYKARSKVKVVLGNATHTKVFHNGEEDPGVKYSGTVRIYHFPPDARFPQDVPSDRAVSSKVVDTQPPKQTTGP